MRMRRSSSTSEIGGALRSDDAGGVRGGDTRSLRKPAFSRPGKALLPTQFALAILAPRSAVAPLRERVPAPNAGAVCRCGVRDGVASGVRAHQGGGVRGGDTLSLRTPAFSRPGKTLLPTQFALAILAPRIAVAPPRERVPAPNAGTVWASRGRDAA